jgi:hypothetical protein
MHEELYKRIEEQVKERLRGLGYLLGDTMILVIGLDAATWKVINPNLEDLPNLKGLIGEGEHKAITLNERPHSASVWCSMFSGKSPEEHGHRDFVVDGELQKREDIKVNFIWDALGEVADIRALNVPFVYPPYNYNCSYKAVGYGLSSDPVELEQDLDNLTGKAVEILKTRPEVFIVVFTMLDKISHFHWGTPLLLEWYRKVDAKLGELLNQARGEDKLIVVSDHGFANWDEVKEHTLPKKTPEGEIKGDHHKEAILITKNVSSPINSPQDVFYAIRGELDSTVDEKLSRSKKSHLHGAGKILQACHRLHRGQGLHVLAVAHPRGVQGEGYSCAPIDVH